MEENNKQINSQKIADNHLYSMKITDDSNAYNGITDYNFSKNQFNDLEKDIVKENKNVAINSDFNINDMENWDNNKTKADYYHLILDSDEWQDLCNRLKELKEFKESKAFKLLDKIKEDEISKFNNLDRINNLDLETLELLKEYYNKYYSRMNNNGKYFFKRFNCNIVLNNDTLFPYKDEYTIKGIELFSDIEEPSIQVAITYDRIHRTYDNDGKEIITSYGKDLTLEFKTFDLFATWYKTLYNIQNK